MCIAKNPHFDRSYDNALSPNQNPGTVKVKDSPSHRRKPPEKDLIEATNPNAHHFAQAQENN